MEIVGSTRKPVLVQDSEYIVEKTYHIATYWGAFKAYLMPQWSLYGSKGVSIYQNDRWNVAVNSCYHPSGQKSIIFGKKITPKYYNAWGTHIGFKRGSHIAVNSRYLQSGPKKLKFWSKTTPKKKIPPTNKTLLFS